MGNRWQRQRYNSGTAGIIFVNSSRRGVVNSNNPKFKLGNPLQNCSTAIGSRRIILPGIILSSAAGKLLMTVSTVVVDINASILLVEKMN